MIQISCPSDSHAELKKAVLEFVERFEHVFGRDWQRSNRNLADPEYAPCYIAGGGTFLRPEGPRGNPEDLWRWDSRDALLPAYERLKALLELGQ